MSTIEWQIPPSMLRWHDELPTDRPVALLIRHSVRDFLPPGDAGYSLPITETGERLAHELGARLGPRLRSLHSSPLLRCRQTAAALAQGAGVQLPVEDDRLLGDPGVFVLDDTRAFANWQELGHEGVMAKLVSSDEAMPYMAKPGPAARFLVHRMLGAADGVPGIHVWATHDSLVTATAARLLGLPLSKQDWPWYLEGAWFWRDERGICVRYRQHACDGVSEPLCTLCEDDVLGFAQRELALTLGADCPARCFLAGGAYKSLLTGRAARDLDIWAPSAEDRRLLLDTLCRRGAKRLAPRSFSEAFDIAGRIVEVPLKSEPTTLEARLARFDLALSAIGVEHRPGRMWKVQIHPLALSSLERREVLLLKPLVNRPHVLATIERMRRYAAELGFTVPSSEEAEAWQVFEAHSLVERLAMLERFAASSLRQFGVAEEAACRCR